MPRPGRAVTITRTPGSCELVPDELPNTHSRADIERRERFVQEQQAGLTTSARASATRCASPLEVARPRARAGREDRARRGSPDAAFARLGLHAARSERERDVLGRTDEGTEASPEDHADRPLGRDAHAARGVVQDRVSSAIVPSTEATGRRSSRPASTSWSRWARGARRFDRPRPRTPPAPGRPAPRGDVDQQRHRRNRPLSARITAKRGGSRASRRRMPRRYRSAAARRRRGAASAFVPAGSPRT